MAHANNITRYSAGARLEVAGGVLVVRLRGPITIEALLHFKIEIIRRHGAELRAIVMDYSEAAVALDGWDLDLVPASSAPGCPTHAPAALVVPADWVAPFALFTLRAAASGLIRQVFSDRLPALRWAQALSDRQPRTTSPACPRAGQTTDLPR